MATVIEVDPDRHLTAPALRLGVFVLASDQAIEEEVRWVVPPGTAIHVARMASYVGLQDGGTAYFRNLATTAHSFQACSGIQAYLYGCTSGEVTFGAERIRSAIAETLPGAEVITPLAAVARAVKALSRSRISILSPYEQDLNTLLSDRLQGSGLAVDMIYSFALAQDVDTAELTRAFFAEAAKRIARDKPECLFIPCNALSVITHIEIMEQILGVPVITSTQASVWNALKNCNFNPTAVSDSFGELFSVKDIASE